MTCFLHFLKQKVTVSALALSVTIRGAERPESAGLRDELAEVRLPREQRPEARGVDLPAFEQRLNELFLQYPNTPVARKAAAGHVAEVKAFVQGIIKADQKGIDSSTLSLIHISEPTRH